MGWGRAWDERKAHSLSRCASYLSCPVDDPYSWPEPETETAPHLLPRLVAAGYTNQPKVHARMPALQPHVLPAI